MNKSVFPDHRPPLHRPDVKLPSLDREQCPARGRPMVRPQTQRTQAPLGPRHAITRLANPSLPAIFVPLARRAPARPGGQAYPPRTRAVLVRPARNVRVVVPGLLFPQVAPIAVRGPISPRVAARRIGLSPVAGIRRGDALMTGSRNCQPQEQCQPNRPYSCRHGPIAEHEPCQAAPCSHSIEIQRDTRIRSIARYLQTGESTPRHGDSSPLSWVIYLHRRLPGRKSTVCRGGASTYWVR